MAFPEGVKSPGAEIIMTVCVCCTHRAVRSSFFLVYDFLVKWNSAKMQPLYLLLKSVLVLLFSPQVKMLYFGYWFGNDEIH